MQAIVFGLSFFGVLTICFLTAVGGGIIRDMLVNDIPSTLQLGFYGTTAIIIGTLIYVLNYFDVQLTLFLPIIFAFGTFLRVYTFIKKVKLPKL